MRTAESLKSLQSSVEIIPNEGTQDEIQSCFFYLSIGRLQIILQLQQLKILIKSSEKIIQIICRYNQCIQCNAIKIKLY